MDLRERILEGTLKVYNEKGIKFTLDDVAAKLKISKKTIYTVFKGKEDLFLNMTDYLFDGIKNSEQAIIDDENLNIVSKLKKVLSAMPESYKDVDFTQLYILKDKYPDVYKRVEQRLETGWENTMKLIEQGMKENKIRRIDTSIFKIMMEASIERFFQEDILLSSGMSYTEGLEQVVDILVNGIVINGGEKNDR